MKNKAEDNLLHYALKMALIRENEGEKRKKELLEMISLILSRIEDPWSINYEGLTPYELAYKYSENSEYIFQIYKLLKKASER